MSDIHYVTGPTHMNRFQGEESYQPLVLHKQWASHSLWCEFRLFERGCRNSWRPWRLNQQFWFTVLSLMRTTSPSVTSRRLAVHFRRLWSNRRYSFFQRAQNTLAKAWTRFHSHFNMSRSWNSPRELASNLYSVFWVSNIAGVSISGKSGSVETGTSGLELMMAATSAMNVFRTSWVNVFPLAPISMESSILRVIPIILSHAPPMWEAWGG